VCTLLFDANGCLYLGIAKMKKQIAAMQDTISTLKQQQTQEKPPKNVAPQQYSPTASSSSVPSVDDELTFAQKMDLSEAIRTLDGPKLERVIQIIHEGVPEIRDVCLFYLFSRSSRQLLMYTLLVPRVLRRLNSISTFFRPTS